MTVIETPNTRFLAKDRLAHRNNLIHEFVLPKEPSLVDAKIAQICSLAPLHELTIEDCRKGNQRAKVERFPDYLFFVIHYFESDENSIRELHLVIIDDSLLLIADSAPPARFKNWLDCLNIKAEQTFAEVMHNVFDSCVDSAERRVAHLEDFVSQTEHAIIGERFNPKIILNLKQQCLQFQRAVSGTHSIVKEFMAIAELNADQKLWYRNILDHQERLQQELTFLHSEMIALFDVFWGASGYYANEQIKRLTLIATIGLPLAFWTSFFGMNFEIIPFKDAWLFGVALSLMGLSVLGVLNYLQRKGIFRSRVTKALNKSP